MVFIHNRSSVDTPITSNQEPVIAEENSTISSVNNNLAESSSAQNIIKNHDFSEGLKGWNVTSKGESGYVVPKEANYLDDVLPYSGINYAVVTHRLKTHQGLEQDITGKLEDNGKYTISAWVRVYGVSLGADGKAKVEATLRLEYSDKDHKYPQLVSDRVSTDEWTKLESTFILRNLKLREGIPKGVIGKKKKGSDEDVNPKRVVFYLEGPDEGVDLLINSVMISPVV